MAVLTRLDSFFWVFFGLLVATGALRLIEVGVSVRRVARRREALVAETWLFPLMVLLHVGLVFAPLVEVLVLERPFVGVLGLTSVSVLGLATALRVWTLRTLGSSWNVRIVRPETDSVVTAGPYRWIRHPNYLAVILEVAALPLFHTAWISALALSALNGFVLFHRIRREERELAAIPAWRDAMAGRARLLPGIF